MRIAFWIFFIIGIFWFVCLIGISLTEGIGSKAFMGASICSIPALIIAFSLWYSMKLKTRKAEKERLEAEEKHIIKVFMENGGLLSVPEVAMHLSLSVDETYNILTKLALKGYLGYKISESGVIIYELKDYVTENEKRTAMDI